MNRVVEILMSRDGITENEAKKRVSEVRELIYDVCDYDEAEEIISQELGLEMDYLLDII